MPLSLAKSTRLSARDPDDAASVPDTWLSFDISGATSIVGSWKTLCEWQRDR